MRIIASLFLSACAFGCAAVGSQPAVEAASNEESPKSEMNALEGGLPNIFVIEESGVGIGVFQRGTGEPYLTLHDADGDGVFDYLEYHVLDAEGQLLRTVEDFGFDGQADLILDYVERSGRVFLNGVWRDIEGVDAGREATVDVDGQARTLQSVVDDLQNGTF